MEYKTPSENPQATARVRDSFSDAFMACFEIYEGETMDQ